MIRNNFLQYWPLMKVIHTSLDSSQHGRNAEHWWFMPSGEDGELTVGLPTIRDTIMLMWYRGNNVVFLVFRMVKMHNIFSLEILLLSNHVPYHILI